MIRDFTDRCPKASAAIVAVLFTLFPMALMLASQYIFGERVNMPLLIFIYSLVIEFIMWENVERMILIFFPFMLTLIGFISAEIIYTVSETASAPGMGPDPVVYLISSLMVTVFGAEAAGFIGAVILHAFVVIGKKLCEFIKER